MPGLDSYRLAIPANAPMANASAELFGGGAGATASSTVSSAAASTVGLTAFEQALPWVYTGTQLSNLIMQGILAPMQIHEQRQSRREEKRWRRTSLMEQQREFDVTAGIQKESLGFQKSEAGKNRAQEFMQAMAQGLAEKPNIMRNISMFLRNRR